MPASSLLVIRENPSVAARYESGPGAEAVENHAPENDNQQDGPVN